MKFPDINYKLRTNTKEDRNANIIKNMICTINFEGETVTLGNLISYASGECVFIETHAIEPKEMVFRNIDEALIHVEAVVEDYCVSEYFYFGSEIIKCDIETEKFNKKYIEKRRGLTNEKL